MTFQSDFERDVWEDQDFDFPYFHAQLLGMVLVQIGGETPLLSTTNIDEKHCKAGDHEPITQNHGDVSCDY